MCGSLETLLAPATSTIFFEEYYEKKFLYAPGNQSRSFQGLFSTVAAEKLLWEQEARLPNFTRVHSNGRDLLPPPALGQFNYRTWMFDQYRHGATIIINNLEHYSLELARFLRDIESFLSCRISAGAYLTPQGSRAFQPHFDPHDVIVVQVEGSKKFDLFEESRQIELPLNRQWCPVEPAGLGPPSREVVLNSGDCLYIPRGIVHAAATQDQRSLHLSIGLHPAKMLDLARTVVELASEANSQLRQSLPIGDAAAEQSTDLEQFVMQISQALGVKISLEAALSRLEERFITGLRPLPDRRVESDEAASALAIDSVVERAPGTPCVVVSDARLVRITFPGLNVIQGDDKMPDAIQAPAVAEEALIFISQTSGPFRIADIPGPLADGAKILLVRKLMHDGLLTMCTDGHVQVYPAPEHSIRVHAGNGGESDDDRYSLPSRPTG